VLFLLKQRDQCARCGVHSLQPPVAIHNLLFTDQKLSDFNTDYKVNPPLRTQNDIDVLIAGLKDGTIDMVTSDHNPLNVELKKIEFDFASYGTVGLESAFGALNSIFTLNKTINLLTKGKERFGIETSSINTGNKLNIALFNPDFKYNFSVKDIVSTSKNSLFLGVEMQGKAYGIYSNNKIVLN